MAVLEFCLPLDDAARLLRLPFLSRQRARPAAADCIWHDTADGALDKAGVSLCEQRGVWRLEGSRPVAGRLWLPGTPAPVIAEAADPAALTYDDGHALPGPLMPLAGLSGRRRVVAITGDGEPARLTLLEGALRGVTQERAVCRVIFEGPADRLLAVSSEAAAAVRLTVPRWSLATEALALARRQAPPPRQVGAPDVSAGTRLTDAVAVVIGHLTDVIIYGAAGASVGVTPEPVHQMRVAVRRLRSALSVFGRASNGPAFAAVKPGLKALAAALGAARDWDVFLLGTGAAIGAALPGEPRVEAMLAAGERHRRRAYAALRVYLEGDAFRGLEVALVQLAALRLWEQDADEAQTARLQDDAEAFAGEMLDRRLARLLEPGDDLSGVEVEALHAIRKDGKRMRYACEFFAPLFGRRAARRFIDRLAALQEALGHLNDTAAASALMDSLGRAPGQQFAAGAVQGYIAARSEDTRREIGRAWGKFRRQEPFWT